MEHNVSRAVYQRDNWHCRHCNNSNGLDPHHVKFASAGGTDTLDNLIALCRMLDGEGRMVIYFKKEEISYVA